MVVRQRMETTAKVKRKATTRARTTPKKNRRKTESGKVEFFTPEELKAHKLEQNDRREFIERYAHGVVNLVDKVQITGSGYGVETRTPESLTIAYKIDRRFDKDAKFPNQYQLIKNIVAGVPVLGGAEPYDGFICLRQDYEATGPGK